MDLIVTGLPRSGLTVAAALVDGLPDAVCLNAPPWQLSRAREVSSPSVYAAWLTGDFARTRRRLLHGRPVADFRAADGSPLMDMKRDRGLPRTAEGAPRPVNAVHSGLAPDFILGMKHHALYTALLPELVKSGHFRIITIIRHPLDVLASWRRMEGSLAQGKLSPPVLRLWPEARRIAAAKSGALDRMVQLYDAFCQRYWEARDKVAIVKYEEMVGDPLIISRLLSHDALPAAASRIERRPRILLNADAEDLRERFERLSVFAKQFYPDI